MREKDVCHHCGADKRDMARLTRERDEARAEVEDLRRRLVFAQSAYDGLAQVVAALEEEEETP